MKKISYEITGDNGEERKDTIEATQLAVIALNELDDGVEMAMASNGLSTSDALMLSIGALNGVLEKAFPKELDVFSMPVGMIMEIAIKAYQENQAPIMAMKEVLEKRLPEELISALTDVEDDEW